MTTIAASSNEGALAGDTLAANENDIATPCVKVFRSRGSLIGIAGDYYAGLLFLEWFDEGAKKSKRPTDAGDFSALILDPDRAIFSCDSHFVLTQEPMDFFAIGSGAAFALSALDLGLSVEEAIHHAAKFDIYTGGRVHIERLS